MKINEVESLAGITKKNIRFYEEQGLLSPRRNAENGYREYGEAELETLRQIKLLRKLGLPIEEIRRILRGEQTLSDGMRRHLVTLERERRNLELSSELCRKLKEEDAPLAELETEELLSRMEEMEKGGARFNNPMRQDVAVRYIAPAIATVLTVALMLALILLILWTTRTAPQDAPPLWFVFIIIGLFAAMACGTVLAFAMRVKEIGKGEIDEAKRY